MTATIDSILFTEAKNLLRKYHDNFSELKAQTKKMLKAHLNISCSDDLVEWTAYIIRSEDWKTFSAERIKEFDSGGRDFSDWLATTAVQGNVTDKWFKPYVEKEALTEARTLADKLTIGMRGSYWLEDKEKAERLLKEAIEELKAATFEPAPDFKFADYYLEMVNNKRYNECSDIITVYPGFVLDKRTQERVLTQAIAASMACGRFEVTQQAVSYGMAIEDIKWAPLSFNMSCYFATKGDNEELMYKYIIVALKNGKHDYDFRDSDFNTYRSSAKFKAIISGSTLEEAEVQEAMANKLSEPQTIEQAEALVNDLYEASKKIKNVISTFFEIESDSEGEPADVELLDNMFYLFKKMFTFDTLVHLFEFSFPTMESNYQLALDAAGELINRKHTEAQLKLVDAFLRAGEYYDAGHRSESDTVQDQLIDSYLPKLTTDALIYLLEKCDTQLLAADGLHNLFVSLLERNPSDELKQRAYKRFVEYYEKEGDTDYYDFQFDNLFPRLTPLLPNNVIEKIEQVKSKRK